MELPHLFASSLSELLYEAIIIIIIITINGVENILETNL